MAIWLIKSEPDEFSILHLRQKGTANWDGVRNFQARNFLRAMAVGDLILFYHSSCKVPGIVGTASVCQTAHPDPSSWNPESPYYDLKSSEASPRWDQVTIEYRSVLKRTIPLTMLKTLTALEGFPLVQKGSRLSVMPVEETYWATLAPLIEANESLS